MERHFDVKGRHLCGLLCLQQRCLGAVSGTARTKLHLAFAQPIEVSTVAGMGAHQTRTLADAY
jgi:hypothetical protein